VSLRLLHPALQHHVAGSLGWQRLRPLQEDAIAPLVAGGDALMLAPTAAGKTEAAVLPLTSRMLSEGWERLSVLYVSPLRALANNLEPRLAELLGLVGRSVAVWHGDVPDAARGAILREPPDLLVTTPESIEVMLTSRRIDHDRLFADLQAIVVDEIHAFAGDDRGWHLRAVLSRLEHLVGHRLQRVGLSATVGNPAPLLAWLSGGGGAVIEAPSADREVEVAIDHVGSLRNAAKVIGSLHKGEKRLAFCDSRSDVEELAAGLRAEGAETFVSHSSISRDDRRQAEEAFSQRTDCVIVATSTLELGIDVGDLDRVIQVDAPATVASFLQRLGRTGRRPGSTANMLFLATRSETLLRGLALDLLREKGYVEPVEPPPNPQHIVAQQLLALCLQEGAVGQRLWADWLEGSGLAAAADPELLAAHMLDRGFVIADGGMLMLGPETERSFGRRNFLELLSVFTTPPLVEVRHGRSHLGQVDQSSFVVREERTPVLLLGGRNWELLELDWKRRIAYVVPADDSGRSRWVGSGPALGHALCQAMKGVLLGETSAVDRSKRAEAELARMRDEYSWLAGDATTLAAEGDRTRWWTFAGTLANRELRWRLGELADGGGGADELSIPVRAHTSADQVSEQLGVVPAGELPIDEQAVDELKFSQCLPRDLAAEVLRERVRDPDAVEATIGSRIFSHRS
jgi:ATP-dependent helicase Lhr and Lhr-like helicase